MVAAPQTKFIVDKGWLTSPEQIYSLAFEIGSILAKDANRYHNPPQALKTVSVPKRIGLSVYALGKERAWLLHVYAPQRLVVLTCTDKRVTQEALDGLGTALGFLFGSHPRPE